MSIKTVSLEMAKLLKKSGFRQYSDFWYMPDSHIYEKNTIWYKEQLDWKICKDREVYSAPTTDELLEELPEIDICKWPKSFGVYKYEDGKNDIIKRFDNESLPEALAQMWIFLKKEGLLDAKRGV